MQRLSGTSACLMPSQLHKKEGLTNMTECLELEGDVLAMLYVGKRAMNYLQPHRANGPG